jgi:hypothetical protein
VLETKYSGFIDPRLFPFAINAYRISGKFGWLDVGSIHHVQVAQEFALENTHSSNPDNLVTQALPFREKPASLSSLFST